jgi:outer membrane protein
MRKICLLVLSSLAGAAAQPLPLTLKRAVEIATTREGNTRVQLATESVKQAQERASEARASLLPDVEASFSDQSRTVNLAALGLQAGTFAIPVPGFHIVTFVGPFTTTDARITASQTIFDFGALRRYQSAKGSVAAARAESDSTDEQVAAQVSRAYLAALRSDMDLETARANVTLSEALLKQAQDLKTAGTGTGIEITRARVQLANDRQRLLAAGNARHSAYLQLLRTMNLRLDTELALTDTLSYTPVEPATLADAQSQALKQRPDLKAQQQREASARLTASATKLERLPSLAAFGDYGAIGTGLDSSLPTRTVGIQLKVPIFDGGRRDARREETASQYRSERVKTADLRDQVELDVRLALDSLKSATEQVKASQEGLTLAQDELAQARRRVDAGVAVSVEITDAQTRLERARDNQTSALYSYNVARLDLAQAMGKAMGFGLQ